MKVSVADARNVARELVQHMREVRQILNGGLRFSDQMRVVTFSWRSTAAPVLLAASIGTPPLAVLVLRVRNANGSGPMVSGVSCEWEYAARGLLVSDIGGTTPGTEYEVTVLIVEG